MPGLTYIKEVDPTQAVSVDRKHDQSLCADCHEMCVTCFNYQPLMHWHQWTAGEFAHEWADAIAHGKAWNTQAFADVMEFFVKPPKGGTYAYLIPPDPDHAEPATVYVVELSQSGSDHVLASTILTGEAWVLAEHSRMTRTQRDWINSLHKTLQELQKALVAHSALLAN